MQRAIDRVIQTYGLLTSLEAAAAVRGKVETYIRTLFEAGETDDNRLTCAASCICASSTAPTIPSRRATPACKRGAARCAGSEPSWPCCPLW